MTRILLALATAVLIGGCSGIATSTTTTSTTPPTIDRPTTAVTAAPEDVDSPCITGDKPFAIDGIISAFGGAGGDATQVSGLRWISHPGCEQVFVDLRTADGAPASAIDPVGVDYDAERGIIRINLPQSVNRSAVSSSLFDGDLVDRVYVVATQQGRLAVDIHITPGTMLALRAYEATSPSRIVIDVREQTDAIRVIGASHSPDVVIVSPLPNWSDTSVDVAGYARRGQGQLVVRVYDDGEVLVEQTIEYGGTTSVWTEFEVSLIGLPARPLELEVVPAGAPIDEAARVAIDTTERPEPDPEEDV